MKKIIYTLCIALCLTLFLSLTSCNGSCSGDSASGTDTTKNDGVITETGTDTNIVDKAESMIDGVESDLMETK